MEDVRPGSAWYYRLHGIGVEIGWEDLSVAGAVDAVLTYFGFTRLDEVPRQPHMAVSFLSRAAAPALPPEARLAVARNGIEVWSTETQVYVREGDSVVQLHPSTGVGTGVIRSPLWNRPGVLRLPLVNLVIHSLLVLLRHRGFYPLHAAALEQEGGGLLLIADSDRGKSTLAMGLVRRGWHYLSDDSVLLRRLGAGVEARPLRRDFGLDEEAAHRFPEIDGCWRPFLTDERKRRVDMKALYPEQAAEACLPRLLLFPEIVDVPESRLVPVGQTEAMLALMQQGVLLALERDTTAAQLEVLERLADQAAGYRLLAGQDLKKNPERIDQLLAPLRAARVAGLEHN